MPTALVTGASRGIGRAIALRLADQHDIVAVARSAEALERLAREIADAGGRCRPIALDVADPQAVARELTGVAVDVLVNNAGIGILKPLLELTPEEWRRQVDVNVNALYHVTRALLPGMVERGRGHVITIGSLAGRNTFAGGTAYTGTKHFVIGFSESLMLEVREHGVKVSVVMPGSVATEFGRGSESGHGESSVGGLDWKLHAEDVAEAVAYLVATPPRALVSRIEMRPAIPKR